MLPLSSCGCYDQKQYMFPIKKIDLFLFIVVAVVIIFIYHFPDLLPLFVTPKGLIYLGHIPYFDPWDTNLYVSAIHYGQWGGVLLANQYTSMPNNPILLYPFLTIIGFIFKSISPFLLFHISNIFGGIILLIGMFCLLQKLGFSSLLALFALFTISLGGGFGFLGWGRFPSGDITMSLFTFYSAFQKAHEAIGVLSFTGALVLFYFFVINKEETIKIFPIMLLLLVSVFIYPYTVVCFFLITGLFLFLYRKGGSIEERDYVHIALLAIPSVAVVLLLAYQIFSNPSFADIGNHIPLAFFPLLAGYGILLPLFLYQLFFLPKTALRIFFSVWFIVVFTLGILPIGPGKVFLRGSFFPITVICIVSLNEIVKNMKRIKYVAFILFGIFLVGSSMYIFCNRIGMVYARSNWMYMSVSDFGVFDYLKKNTLPDSSIFSLITLGSQIPAFTENRVYLGHTMQTPQAADKQATVIAFFIGEGSVAQEKEMLRQNNISYVLLGKNEESLYKKYAKKENSLYATLDSFQKVFQSQNISLYKVQ